MKKLKVAFNEPFFSLRQINIPNGTIKPKEVFQLVEVWYDSSEKTKGVWIAIQTDNGIVECGFKFKKKISSRHELKEAMYEFLVPYIEGVEYVFIKLNH